MGFFTDNTTKSAAETPPHNPDIIRHTRSGAEQDRYEAHFAPSAERIDQRIDAGVDKLKDAVTTSGSGAEQDRYNLHFSPAEHDTDLFRVQQAAQSIKNRVQTGAATSMHGLGYDGQQRAEVLAGGGGGAEQDRLGEHFGLTKEGVESVADRVKDGARNVLPRQ